VEILFCAEGEAQLLDDRREVVALPRGAAALVPAAVPTLLVEGDAKLFRAGVPG
jgi:mannose-6-phosphate isomerase class I